MDEPFSVVCAGTRPWDDVVPHTGHHMMRALAAQGRRTLYLETNHFIGRDVSRRARSRPDGTVRRLFGGDDVVPGITVARAVNLLPRRHKYGFAAKVNSAATVPFVRRLIAGFPKPVVLWIYDPTALSMAGSLGEALTVYDCVDDLPEHVGEDPRRRAFIALADRRAAERADLVFATSTVLRDRHVQVNPKTFLYPNGTDHVHFSHAADRSAAAPEVAGLRRPVIGFAGNFINWKIDFALLEHVARARPDWTLLLVGPADKGTHEPLTRLARLANVEWLGARPYSAMPGYVAAFDVGLCPYQWNAAMQSGFPLKLYECLAAGKPVVATGNPDLAGMEPDVVLVRDPAEAVTAIEAALRRDSEDDRTRRMALGAQHTWERRALRLVEHIAAELQLATQARPASVQADELRAAATGALRKVGEG